MNSTVNAESRGEYLRMMKESKVERVFLAVCELWDNEETVSRNIASLKENIAFFEENGIEAAIWQGATVGHGGVLSHDTEFRRQKTYSPLINIDGQAVYDTRCPLDKEFQRDVSDYITRLARETGAKLILLDDDFRISQHSDAFCCACDKHLALMSEICGEEIKREEIAEKVFGSKPNKYRKAYAKAMSDSLLALAAEMRRTMDEFDPTVRIGICAVPCHWNVDGTTGLEISKALAGNTEPCLRLSGAPYWAVVSSKTMPMVLESERMYLSFCPEGEAELMSEGDVYPRPRYTVPAAHLEIFDAALRASGFGGILKYMIDYSTSPYYDQSYVKHHLRNLPLHEAIGEIFDQKKSAGVKVYACGGIFENADYTLSTPTHYTPSTYAGIMLQNCGIPTFYGEGEADAVAVFGESARHIPLDMIKDGAIIDGVAAAILAERGVDVGFVGSPTPVTHEVSFIKTENEATVSVFRGKAKFIAAPVSERARVVASMTLIGDLPVAYRYENADGQKFTVFTFDSETVDRKSGLLRGFAVEKILLDGIAEIAVKRGRKLSAHCPASPELYTLCARSEGKLSVGLFNCYADDVLDPVIELDRKYSKARFEGCQGRLEGNRLFLSDISAFKFAAVELCE